jgi:hypothetical protein
MKTKTSKKMSEEPWWIYQGFNFDESLADAHFGFVYVITNITTVRLYIGKKLFSSAGYKTVKGKRKRIRKPSDWKSYWGSSKLLQADIEQLGHYNFTREIVRLCDNRSQCTYYESKMILETDAIIREDFYNDWISCKISSMHVSAIYKK